MKRALAILLTAVMVLAVTGCGSGQDAPYAEARVLAGTMSGLGEEDPDAVDADLLSYGVVLATYPEAVPYPKEEDFLTETGEVNMEAYGQAYEDWAAASLARPAVPESAAGLDGFFRDSVRQFLGGDQRDRAVSPLDIYMALAMLAEAAGGQGRAQILTALGTGSIEALRDQADQIWSALYLDDGTSSRIPGASVWLDAQMRYKETAMQVLAERYHASSFQGVMGSPEYDTVLRAWLDEQTRGLLKEQSSGVGLTPDTLLALASTLYFKAPWTDQFDAAQTRPDTFHAPSGDRTVPFMHRTSTGTLYQGEGFSAVCLPLAGGEMWLILPDAGKGPSDLLADGSAMEFLASPQDHARTSRAKIVLSLPKFDVSCDLDLKDGLKALGIGDVFDSAKADFSPILEGSQRAVVSAVQHAARVKIDEEGCEAAAFTVIMAEATAMMEEPPTVQFDLDRPFLFAVTAEDLPLFVGRIDAPAAA